MYTTGFEPIAEDGRLPVLDVLRGAAVLGILLMNILNFGLPLMAYSNPLLWGGADTLNLGVFAVHWVLFEGKMRGLLSLMFGAGVVAFMTRALLRDDGAWAADLYCRRMLWLMAFGAVHAWVIWHGDVLYSYGLWGLLLLPLRNASPRALFISGAIALAVTQVFLTTEGFKNRSIRDAAVAARAAEAAGRTLTDEQREAIRAWDQVYNVMVPSRETLQREVDDYRGGYASTFTRRLPIIRAINFMPVYFPPAGDILGMMLLGMGLFKLGVLQGSRSARLYAWMAIVGYGIGIPLNAVSAYGMISSQFEPIAIWLWNGPHQLGRVAVVLGHAAVIILLVKHARLTALTDRLAAVGRMAMSNYIATSIIAVLIFYTPGLGLMGQLQRYQLYFVVAAIWGVNIAWSSWWLRRFHFGPLEWSLRSLAYRKRQPLLRSRTHVSDALSPTV